MRRIGAAEASLWAPALRAEALRGAILSWDGQLEDDARLVVALARTAAARGARIVTYCEVDELTGAGARVHDAITDSPLEIRARQVVNATGVWADRLVDGIRLRPSKGAHVLVAAERLGRPRAMLNVPVPGHLGRFVFAVPRSDGLVMIGLTDDPFDDVSDTPPVSARDEAFLLETVSSALRAPLTSADVVGRFAGLRPLLDSGTGATSDISRSHAVVEDQTTGAVTVVGGKLTTYRQMAEDAVDAITARPGIRAGPCRTARLPLVGAQPPGAARPDGVPERLVTRFGAEAGEIAALAEGQRELLEPVALGLPVLGVELIAAVQREGALTLDDVLERRTRLGLVPAWRDAARPAAECILPDLAPLPT